MVILSSPFPPQARDYDFLSCPLEAVTLFWENSNGFRTDPLNHYFLPNLHHPSVHDMSPFSIHPLFSVHG